MNRLDIILRHDSYQANRSQGSPSRFLASPDARAKLSTSIDKSTLGHGETRTAILNLANRYIEELDSIPTKYKRAHTLVLNNNHLKNLRGVEQFSRLKKLDVADNELDDILNVYYLAALPMLEEVDFRGNGIVNIPNYRETIFLFVPSIRVLDGKAVKQQEKDKIRPEVKKQYTLLEKLLGNYIELIKLQSIVKKLEVHKELFNRDRKFLMNFVKFDVKKFKKMYNYFQDIDEKVRNDYRTDLLRDVRVIEVNFLQRDDMEAAVQELSSRQLAKIDELTKQIEKKASVLESVYSANIHKLKRFKVHDNVLVEPEKFKSPGKRFGSPLDSRLSQRYGRDYRSPQLNDSQTMRGFLSPVDTTLRPIKSERDFGLRSSTRSQSAKRKGTTDRLNSRGTQEWTDTEYESRGHRKMHSVNLVQSPAYPEDYQDVPQQLSVSQMGYQDIEREGEEPEEVIPREVIVEKDKEITTLAKDLQEKIEEVIKVSGVNKLLKDKLKDFEEQNYQNSKIAQEEAERILQQAQVTKDSCHELEREAKDLKTYLQQLRTTNEELEDERDRIEQENSQLMVFKEEVKGRQVLEEKEVKAENYHKRKLVEKGFLLLGRAVRRSKIVEEMYRNSRDIKAYLTLETVFGVLKKLMIIRRIGRYQRQERSILFLQKIVTSWREIARRKKVAKYWHSKRNSDLLYSAFVCWSNYKNIRQDKSSIKDKIQGYYNRKLLRLGLQGFRKIFMTFRLEESVEIKLEEFASNYFAKRVLKNSFVNWRDYVQEVLVPKKEKNQLIQGFYSEKLQKLGFQLLKINKHLYKRLNESAGFLREQKDLQLMKAVFNVWKTDYRVVNSIREEEKRLQELFFLRKRFMTWRREFINSQREAALESKADSHFLKHLVVKSFHALALSSVLAKRRRVIQSQLKAQKTSNLLINSYKKWREAYLNISKNKKKAELHRLETERYYFDRWQEYFRLEKEDRLINARALRLREKGLGRYANLIFRAWRAWSKWSKRSKALLEYRKERKVKKIYRKVFEEFRMVKLREAKDKYDALNKEYRQEEARVQRNLEEIRNLDQERFVLTERLEELNRNTAELREETYDQDRYVEKCKDHVKVKEDAISRLEKELIERERETEKVEKENKRTQENIQKKTREFENVQNDFSEEKGRLNEEVLKLERELDRRTKMLEEAEREKRQQSDELEDIVRKNEEIIDAFCKELKEFKSTLGLKEQEVREATELIGEFEIRNRALKDQVEDTLGDMERTSIDYSERIQQLELQNQILVDQMRGLDRQSEAQVEEMRELKDVIRRIEQEAGSIAEQQHKDTEEFIRNLQRSRIIDEQSSSRYSQRAVSPQRDELGRSRVERPIEEEQRESIRRELAYENRTRENRTTSGSVRRQPSESGDISERLTGHKYHRNRPSQNPIYEETLSREETKADDFGKITPREQTQQPTTEEYSNIKLEERPPQELGQ